MNPTPLFSVVVASYNNGRYLDEMIESVIQQTWPNWELIIAEDCSTDNSLDILSKGSSDSRIQIIEHKTNQGAGGAFGTATRASNGIFVGMLGADDALHPDALKKMTEAHLNYPNASLISSLAMGCDEFLKPTKPFEHTRNLKDREDLIHHPVVGNFATFKNESYQKTEGFNSDLKKAVDRDLFLKLDEVGEVQGVDEYLYYYRLHDGGISQGGSGIQANQYAILATAAAYKRRRRGQKPNLSPKQYRNILKTWYLRECHPLRWVERRKCNQLLLRGVLEVPSLCLTKGFWSVLVRNNMLRP